MHPYLAFVYQIRCYCLPWFRMGQQLLGFVRWTSICHD